MNKRWKIKKEIEIGRGSEIRESNPPHRLGKPVHYRCANLANLCVVLMFWNRKESHERDSNPRPTHYECVALPTEPFRQQDFGNRMQKYGSFPKQQSIFAFFCIYGILFSCFSQAEKTNSPKHIAGKHMKAGRQKERESAAKNDLFAALSVLFSDP